MPNSNETTLLFKVLISLLGVILGLWSKLAIMKNNGSLTWNGAIMHTSIAFASSFFVWALCYYNKQEELGVILSVICGRFGDDLLFTGWKVLKKTILESNIHFL